MNTHAQARIGPGPPWPQTSFRALVVFGVWSGVKLEDVILSSPLLTRVSLPSGALARPMEMAHYSSVQCYRGYGISFTGGPLHYDNPTMENYYEPLLIQM